MTDQTIDLFDDHEEDGAIQVVCPGIRDDGGRKRFSGPRRTVSERGKCCSDGGGSLWSELVGDVVGQIAADNGGAVIAGIDVGPKAPDTTFRPGDYAYLDGDGIVLSAVALH